MTIREAIAQSSHLSKILKNGTDIVTIYHGSQPSPEHLHASQKKLGLLEKKLVTAIENRWNSEYPKEKRLFENREPLMLSCSQLKSNIFRSSEEWEKVSQFFAILKPFFEATVISSGKKYVSLSTLTPLLLGLEKNTEKLKKRMENDENFGYLFCQSLLKRLKERFPRNYKYGKYHLLAMLWDPRYKDVWVKNKSQRAPKELLNFIKSVLITRTSSSSHELDIETSLEGSGSVWDAFDEASQRKEIKSSADHDTDLTLEIDAYFSQKKIERSENPLEFWNLNKLCFPKLAEAARIVLAIPATAEPSERVRSDA